MTFNYVQRTKFVACTKETATLFTLNDAICIDFCRENMVLTIHSTSTPFKSLHEKYSGNQTDIET